MNTNRSAPAAALIALVLVWGYSWVAMKIGLRHAHPFDFAALRVGIGALLLFALLAVRRKPLRLASYRMAMLLGTVQVALFVILSQFALMRAGPGKTSVLVFTMPFWMIVFARYILHERMQGAQWIAVGLAVVGLTLIVAPWELTSLEGSLYAVAAGAVWAMAAVLSKKWPTSADPLLFTAWQLAVGTVWLSLLAWLHPHAPVDWAPEFLMALAFSTILATALGWWLWTYVLANSSAGMAGLNSLGIPVVAVASSALQLGERPPALELAGMAAVAAALGLMAWLGMRRPAVSASASRVS